MRIFGYMIFATLLMILTACQGTDGNNNNNGGTNGEAQQTEYNNMNNNDRNENLDMVDMDRNRNNGMNDDRTNNNNNNEYDVASRAADRITKDIKEIDQAYVITGENNAYVAVVLNNNTDGNGEVSDQLKKRVADVVRSVKGDIENVYVSANPKFFDMVNDYVDDVQNGEPIEGFFEEFNDMIQRIFPNLER